MLTVLAHGVSTQSVPTGGAQRQGQAGVAPGVVMGPVTDLVAAGIPGVVAGGEKVELLARDVKSGDGVMGLEDGSALFIELTDGNVRRVSPDKEFPPLVRGAGVRAIGADRHSNVIALL